jgi:hypothetical protein
MPAIPHTVRLAYFQQGKCHELSEKAGVSSLHTTVSIAAVERLVRKVEANYR